MKTKREELQKELLNDSVVYELALKMTKLAEEFFKAGEGKSACVFTEYGGYLKDSAEIMTQDCFESNKKINEMINRNVSR